MDLGFKEPSRSGNSSPLTGGNCWLPTSLGVMTWVHIFNYGLDKQYYPCPLLGRASCHIRDTTKAMPHRAGALLNDTCHPIWGLYKYITIKSLKPEDLQRAICFKHPLGWTLWLGQVPQLLVVPLVGGRFSQLRVSPLVVDGFFSWRVSPSALDDSFSWRASPSVEGESTPLCQVSPE